jgi:putative DNA primase/helicase
MHATDATIGAGSRMTANATPPKPKALCVVKDNIPPELRAWLQWVLWHLEDRNPTDDKPTKVPYQINGAKAKANDPSTWTDFNCIWDRYQRGGYDGIGFMFSEDDDFCGIDLDGCRDPKTGVVAEWACEIINRFRTYTEVSPSGTGVKLFACGKSPLLSGKNKKLTDTKPINGKTPGIEVYDHKRYFAVTGRRATAPDQSPCLTARAIEFHSAARNAYRAGSLELLK